MSLGHCGVFSSLDCLLPAKVWGALLLEVETISSLFCTVWKLKLMGSNFQEVAEPVSGRGSVQSFVWGWWGGAFYSSALWVGNQMGWLRLTSDGCLKVCMEKDNKITLGLTDGSWLTSDACNEYRAVPQFNIFNVKVVQELFCVFIQPYWLHTGFSYFWWKTPCFRNVLYIL